MNDRIRLPATLALLLLASSARAQTSLSTLDAVTAAAKNSPALQVALLQERGAAFDVEAADALYVPIFTASGGYTHTRTPSARGADTRITTNDAIDLGAALTKTFALGTQLSATVTSRRSVQQNPAAGLAGAQAVTTPQYSLTGKLALTQPLLRGFGTDVGLATLRQARLTRTANELAARQAASQILHDVLSDYWELWYSSEALRINQASRDLAKAQQDQANEQVKSGAIAPADAYQYATTFAQLEQQVVAAEADRRQKALALTQDMADERAMGGDLTPSDSPNPAAPVDDAQRATNEAIANSYALKQQEALIALARDRAKIAGDPLRPRLDLDAYVSASGLGNGRVPPAVDQVGELQAVSAHVGLTYETPLTDTRRSAQISSALVDAHIAEKTLEATRIQLRNDVQAGMLRMETAAKSVELAQRTQQVAEQQVEAEKSRFLSGTALAIEVAQSVDALRRAQLSVQRARVDLAEAELDLLHLRGRLLERYTDVLKRFAPNTVAISGASGPM